jgi:hypothetical protein
MKKYIFTEGQVKKVIDHLMNEEMSSTAPKSVSGTIRKARTIQDDVDTIQKLKTKKVKLTVLGFRSSMSTSDLYNKNYKRPTVVGSIGGVPIDKNATGKQFDNDTTITLIEGGTLVFGIVGVDRRYAEANGGLTLTAEGGKLNLDFAWD